MARNKYCKAIGVRIGKVREDYNERQNELQKGLGITSRETVTQWENGKREPKASDIRAIADRYNISADWLLARTPLDGSRAIEGNLRAAYEYTGLSDKALRKLHSLKDIPKAKALDLISKLLESPHLDNLLLLMEQAEGAANSKPREEWTDEENAAFNTARNALRKCPYGILHVGEAAAGNYISDAAYTARRMIEEITRTDETGKRG